MIITTTSTSTIIIIIIIIMTNYYLYYISTTMKCDDNSRSLFDAHCHLQLDPIYSNIDDVISKAKDHGIITISVCGVKVGNDWERVSAIASKYSDIIIPSYGIHPWYIQSDDNDSHSGKCCYSNDLCPEISGTDQSILSDDWESKLRELLAKNTGAHVGEVGLDKNIKRRVDMNIQIDILRRHIRIARHYSRVLSLHCVGCWGKLLNILKDELGKNNDDSSSNVSGILLHSCNSLPHSMLKDYSTLPVPTYFSLNGKVSQTNEDMKRMIKAIPSQSLLIETDSPDQLIPSLAKDGIQFNEPFYLIYTAEIIAEILGMSTTELSKLTLTNANNLFKLSIENNENS